VDDFVVIPSVLKAPQAVLKKLKSFTENFAIHEIENGSRITLYLDQQSDSYYVLCHLKGKILSESCDTEATLDADEEDELYKLNREITEDQVAYKVMEDDALKGRSFEDLVLEYDTTYRPKKPLKVYGGQHRLRAISKARLEKGDIVHGARVYFALSREQKVEIATVNNTSIAVPNDLLDRMREQLIGSDLREWCQRAGLLDQNEDFADRRSPDVPTVRLARTLLVNYHLGKKATNVEDFHQPILCKSGGVDEQYIGVRKLIDWSDPNMLEMGQQFARLHKKQRKTVLDRDKDSNAEFARKALSLAVVASWGYAAGLFQRNPDYLQNLYSIPDNVNEPNDPLNAKALSQARWKGFDSDTYRGLGTRSDAKELGRMLEVFLVLVSRSKETITKKLADAAIQSYEAKRAMNEANKVLGRI
jgi:hypothetical protein